jgi:class 3 adenylate cyclase
VSSATQPSRPWTLRRLLSVALVVAALLAVLTFGALNFFAARQLLLQGTEAQLAGIGSARTVSIAGGAQRLVGEISVAASDLGLARALEEFVPRYDDLDDRVLSTRQRQRLDDYYAERVVGPLNDAGLGPVDVEELVPPTAAAQWIQFHYTIRPPDTDPPVDAGDGSSYSRLNARVTDPIESLSDAYGGGDILLIDDVGRVVYSLDKRNDVGTNLVTGPYSGTALAQDLSNSALAVRAGGTILTDFAVTPSGETAMFAVTALATETALVGAVAVEIPVQLLNDLVSANDSWDEVGLVDGDAYIVSSSQTLQSEPRAWVEDPSGYLERLREGDEADQAEADRIELFGSPVGVQQVATEPVQDALDGQDFRGPAEDYFGDATFSASQSFSAAGRQWVVVTEVPRSAALQPLTHYLIQIVVVLLIVLPLVALIGAWLSRRLIRPIPPTVAAAEAIAAGEREPDLDTTRRDEFGDLARRLTAMAAALGRQEAQLTEEYERTRALLQAVLPEDLVDEQGRIVGSGEAAEKATVVAIALATDVGEHDPDLIGDVLQRAAQLADTLGEQTGLRRIRAAADRYLFVAGLGEDGAGADAALTFAAQFRERLDSEAGDVDIEMHMGLSTGPVATGLLSSGSLTFGAWGEPVRQALALAGLSRVDSVLVDATTAAECTDCQNHEPLEPATDVVDLDGEAMDLYRLPLREDEDVSAAGAEVR